MKQLDAITLRCDGTAELYMLPDPCEIVGASADNANQIHLLYIADPPADWTHRYFAVVRLGHALPVGDTRVIGLVDGMTYPHVVFELAAP